MTATASADDLALLEQLANGVDPFTGEVLPNEHLLQHPQLIRVLLRAAHALAEQGKKSKRKSSLPPNAGRSWDKDEDAQLIQEFDTQTSIPEIARQHGRTVGAITSRLLRFGKISPQETASAAKQQ